MNIWKSGGREETDTNHKRLNDREQTEGGRWRWTRWVMGIKEGPCGDEHWALYESIPENNIALYIKKKKKKSVPFIPKAYNPNSGLLDTCLYKILTFQVVSQTSILSPYLFSVQPCQISFLSNLQ